MDDPRVIARMNEIFKENADGSALSIDAEPQMEAYATLDEWAQAWAAYHGRTQITVYPDVPTEWWRPPYQPVVEPVYQPLPYETPRPPRDPKPTIDESVLRPTKWGRTVANVSPKAWPIWGEVRAFEESVWGWEALVSSYRRLATK